MKNNLKKIIEDFIEYTTTWNITKDEWHENVNCTRQNAYGKENTRDI